MFDYIILA